MGRGYLVLGSRRGFKTPAGTIQPFRADALYSGTCDITGGSVDCAMKNAEYHAPEYKFLYHSMLADSRFRV